MNAAPPSTTLEHDDLERRLDELLGNAMPDENRAWIEAYAAEAARLRALGLHGDIIVEPNGDVLRIVDGVREVVAFGDPSPDAPVSWWDPTTFVCGGVDRR